MPGLLGQTLHGTKSVGTNIPTTKSPETEKKSGTKNDLIREFLWTKPP